MALLDRIADPYFAPPAAAPPPPPEQVLPGYPGYTGPPSSSPSLPSTAAPPPQPTLNAPTVGTGLTSDQIAQMIQNDPQRRYQLEMFNKQQGLALSQAQAQAALAGGGGGGGFVPDYSKLLAIAKQQTEEQKSEAARKDAIAAQYNWERLASMGQATAGTPAVERDNQVAELEHLFSQLDLQYEAEEERINIQRQQAQAAAAAAAAAASRARAAAQLQVTQLGERQALERQMFQYDLDVQTGARIANYWWDPSTQLYIGPNGSQYTAGQMAQMVGGATPPPAV